MTQSHQRTEILVQVGLSFVLMVLYVLIPVYSLSSSLYSQQLTALGLTVKFLGSSSFLLLPSGLVALTMFGVSAVIPLIWKSRYGVYLSAVAVSLGTSLLLTTLILRERFFFYSGYSVLPTDDGAFYIRIPFQENLGVPIYLSFALLALSALNAGTNATWLPQGRKTLIERAVTLAKNGNLVAAIELLGRELQFDVELTDTGIRAGKVEVRGSGVKRIDIFFPRARGKEILLVGKGAALLVGGKGPKFMSTEEALRLIIERNMSEPGVEVQTVSNK